jgi:hypothetical protein
MPLSLDFIPIISVRFSPTLPLSLPPSRPHPLPLLSALFTLYPLKVLSLLLSSCTFPFTIHEERGTKMGRGKRE